MSMSWKKYGGTNKLDRMNNMNVNNLTTDAFAIQTPYQGDFDICGNLSSNNIYAKSIFAESDLTVNGALNAAQLEVANLNVNTDSIINGNLSLVGRLIFDTSGTSVNSYFSANEDKLGLNTPNPLAALDIQGNDAAVFRVFSEKDYTRNIIAQNFRERGIAVETDSSSSAVVFYNDASMSSNTNAYSARIQYTRRGILNIDADETTNVLSKMVVSNRVDVSNVLASALTIYDSSSGVYQQDVYKNTTAKAGQSLAMVANDVSSVTMMHMITPNQKGLAVSAGAYPNDQKRSMATFGWMDTTGTSNVVPPIIPSQMIVSGNNRSKYMSTVGINTYAPRTEKYVLDINGPIHVANGQLRVAQNVPFEIKQVSRTHTIRDKLIAVGSPSTTSIFYTQNIYYSEDAGQSWNVVVIDPTNSTDLAKFAPNTFNGIYAYDNSFSILAGQGGYIFYTVNSGKNWNQISITEPFTYNDLYIDASYVTLISDATMYFFPNPYPEEITIPPGNINRTLTTVSMPVFSTLNPAKSICGNGTYLYVVGSPYILKYNQTTHTFISSNSQFKTYYSVHCYGSNVVAVGDDIISYSTDNGTNWTNINPGVNVKLKSVFILDEKRAIAAGDSGVILYTQDSYSTWAPIPTDVLRVSGNAGIVTDASNHFVSVQLADADTLVLSATRTTYSVPSSRTGNSYLFYCYLPSLFNPANNNVLDLCGNMFVGGNVSVEEGIFVAKHSRIATMTVQPYNVDVSGNVSTDNLSVRANAWVSHMTVGNITVTSNATINSNITINGNTMITNLSRVSNMTESRSATSGAFVIAGGVGIGSNLYVGGNVTVNRETSFEGNVRILKTTESGNQMTGALLVSGGAGIGANLSVGGNINVDASGKVFIYNTDYGSGYGQGALVVSGGAAFGGNVHVGGNVKVAANIVVDGFVEFAGDTYIDKNSESASTDTGSLVVLGGVGLSANLFVGGNSTIYGNSRFYGNTVLYSNTASTNPTSGAFQLMGGAGISGNMYVGGLLVSANTSPSFGSSTGSFRVLGGAGISGNTYVGGLLVTTDTTAATGTGTGALRVSGGGSVAGNLYVGHGHPSSSVSTGTIVVNGGVGVNANVYVGGFLVAANTTAATNTSTGSLLVSGGAGIAGNLYVGHGEDSTSTSTGTLVVSGGAGIRANAYIGGNVAITSTTPAHSSTTGALQVSGGIGVVGNAYIGGNVRITNTTIDAASTTTGALVVSGGLAVGLNTHMGGNLVMGGGNLVQSGGSLIRQSGTGTNLLKTTEFSGQVDMSYNSIIDVSAIIGTGANIVIQPSNNVRVQGTTPITLFPGQPQGAETSTINGIMMMNNAPYSAGMVIEKTDDGNILSYGINVRQVGQTSIPIAGGIFRFDTRPSKPLFQIITRKPGSIATAEETPFQIDASGNTTVNTTTSSSSASTGAFTVSGGVGIGGNLYVGNLLVNTDTTAATSAGTGALRVSGGGSIAGNLYVGHGHPSSSVSTGTVVVNGGVGVSANVHVGGFLVAANTTAATSTSTGSLLVSGGAGIVGNLYVGGQTVIRNSSASLENSTTGALLVDGGVGVGGNVFVDNMIRFKNNSHNKQLVLFDSSINEVPSSATQFYGFGINDRILRYQTDVSSAIHRFYSGTSDGILVAGNLLLNTNNGSTNTTSGTLRVAGGAGFAGNVYVGGQTVIRNSSASLGSSTTGALLVDGGVGVGGNVFVDNMIRFNNIIHNKKLVLFDSGINDDPSGATQFYGFGINGYTLRYQTDVSSAIHRFYSGTNDGVLVAGNLLLNTNNGSTSTASGTLRVAGGAGFGGNVYIGGQTVIRNSSASLESSTTGALLVDGGVGVGGNVFVDNMVRFNKVHNKLLVLWDGSVNEDPSGATEFYGFGTNSGALRYQSHKADTIHRFYSGTSDGILVAGNLLLNTNNGSTNTATGTLRVAGGAGIGGNAYIKGILETSSMLKTSNTLVNKKIVIEDSSLNEPTTNATLFYGFGVNTNVLRYQTDSSSAIHRFYSGGSDGNIVAGTLELRNTTPTLLSTAAGALIVTGGAAINGNIYANRMIRTHNSLHNKKIVLLDNSENEPHTNATLFYGFGVNTSMLRYQTDVSSAVHRFYSGSVDGNVIAGLLQLTANTVSTTTSTGALRVTGGVGVGGQVTADSLMGRIDINDDVSLLDAEKYIVYGDTYGLAFKTYSSAMDWNTVDPSSLSPYTVRGQSGGYTSDFTNLSTATNGILSDSVNGPSCTVEWYGRMYISSDFFVDDGLGPARIRFELASDDNSRLWFGSNADSPTTQNTTLSVTTNVPGSNAVNATINTYIPIRIQYKNDHSAMGFRLRFKNENSGDYISFYPGIFFPRNGNPKFAPLSSPRFTYNNQRARLTSPNIRITSDISSNSQTTGALVVVGGVGISEKINIGQGADIYGEVKIRYAQRFFSSTNQSSLVYKNGDNFVIEGDQASSICIISNRDNTSTLYHNALFDTTNIMFNSGALFFRPKTGDTSTNTQFRMTHDNGVCYIQTGYIGNTTYAPLRFTNVNDTNAALSIDASRRVTIGTNTATSGAQLTVDGGIVSVLSTESSTSSATGALRVSGGVGVGGNAYIHQILRFNDSTINKKIVLWDGATSEDISTAISFYGFGVNSGVLRYQANSTSDRHHFYSGSVDGTVVAGNLTLTRGADSTSTSTGTLIVNGGVGISGTVNLGGPMSIKSGHGQTSNTGLSLVGANGKGLAFVTELGNNDYNDMVDTGDIGIISYPSNLTPPPLYIGLHKGSNRCGIRITDSVTTLEPRLRINTNEGRTGTSALTIAGTTGVLNVYTDLANGSYNSMVVDGDVAIMTDYDDTLYLGIRVDAPYTSGIRVTSSRVFITPGLTVSSSNNPSTDAGIIRAEGAIFRSLSSTDSSEPVLTLSNSSSPERTIIFCTQLQNSAYISSFVQAGDAAIITKGPSVPLVLGIDNASSGIRITTNNTNIKGDNIYLTATGVFLGGTTTGRYIQCGFEGENTSYMDFYSADGFTNQDYSVRLSSTGGSTEGAGTFTIGAATTVITGILRPSAGSGNNGIIFPLDPGGGSGDKASIQYYVEGGERTILEIKIGNDAAGGGNDDYILLTSSAGVGIGGKPDSGVALQVNGTVKATTFNATSDYRIKSDIVPLENTHYSVDSLNPVFYYNTLSKKKDIGFIAHEVQEEYPFLVSGEKDGENNQSLNYLGLIGVLVKEVQQLKKANANLMASNEVLMASNAELKKDMMELKDFVMSKLSQLTVPSE